MTLMELAIQWVDTGDIYYRDTLKSKITLTPGKFEDLCAKALIEFPNDPHHINRFLDAIAEGRLIKHPSEAGNPAGCSRGIVGIPRF